MVREVSPPKEESTLYPGPNRPILSGALGGFKGGFQKHLWGSPRGKGFPSGGQGHVLHRSDKGLSQKGFRMGLGAIAQFLLWQF